MPLYMAIGDIGELPLPRVEWNQMPSALAYREFAPAPAFRPYIECYWSLRALRHHPAYPVLPDGCADLLFTGGPELQMVGCMTVAREFALAEGSELFGVRFRPAMAALFVRAPWPELTDQTMPAEGAKVLNEQIGAASHTENRIAAVENWLRLVKNPGPVQRILRCASPNTRIDELSRQAGLSARQLRRVFLAETGLTPKYLYRVLRFRRAIQKMPSTDFASLALDAGFYDQAHFIHEFRQFSGGHTPAAWQSEMADFSNPA